MEQIQLVIEKSRGTKIYLMILFNVLMGLRCSEIIAIKYSDIDYVNRTLNVHKQLGRPLGVEKEEMAQGTYTKQPVPLKTASSRRILPIPDYVFEAVMEQRKIYEKNKSRRKKNFLDEGYICCSSYGRPRSRSYHYPYFKELLKECGLPDIRWHDLRSTFCTLLLKNDFNSKAVANLMGHAKELVTMDVYGDNQQIIEDVMPEIQDYLQELLPKEEEEQSGVELTDIEIDVSDYLGWE